MNKANGKIVLMSVIATFAMMYVVHNVTAFDTVKHAVGLDD